MYSTNWTHYLKYQLPDVIFDNETIIAPRSERVSTSRIRKSYDDLVTAAQKYHQAKLLKDPHMFLEALDECYHFSRSPCLQTGNGYLKTTTINDILDDTYQYLVKKGNDPQQFTQSDTIRCSWIDFLGLSLYTQCYDSVHYSLAQIQSVDEVMEITNPYHRHLNHAGSIEVAYALFSRGVDMFKMTNRHHVCGKTEREIIPQAYILFQKHKRGWYCFLKQNYLLKHIHRLIHSFLYCR